MASLTVITSQRETFSMPVAESLCCGTPVVGFQAGGPESIALAEYTRFVPYGDVAALYDVVLEFMSRPFDPVLIAKDSLEVYSEEKMYMSYERAYREMIED